MPRTKAQSLTQSSGDSESTTSMPPKTPTTPAPPKSVRVWAEVGVTVAVSEDPPQFVKFLFGHERIAPNDKPDTIERYERLCYEACESVVEKRVRKIKRMMKSI